MNEMTQFWSHQLQPIYLWISQVGPWAPILYCLFAVAALTAFVPVSVLNLGSGVILGTPAGTLAAVTASTCAAALFFAIGRFLRNHAFFQSIQRNARFRILDRALSRNTWQIVLLIRLTPFLPFNIINFILGYTSVSFRTFVLITFAGLIPGTIMHVYAGDTAGHLVRFEGIGLLDTALMLLGAIVISVAVFKLQKKAKALLRKALQSKALPR